MSIEVFEATQVFRTPQKLEFDKLMARNTFFCCFEKKNIFKKNDVISSEILPSFRIEAVEDRDVTFDQIQGS